MPTTSRDYALNVIADITEYQRRFAEVPGYTDKKAAAAAAVLEKRLTAAQKEAAKQAEKAAQKGALSWSDAFKLSAVESAFGTIKQAVAAAGEFSQANADAINDINDLSTRTGVAAGTIAGLRTAFEGSGQAAGDVSGVLLGLGTKLASIEKGSKKAGAGFVALGVDVHDSSGRLRSAEEVLQSTLAALAAVPDPADRARLATAAFGDQGTKLLQALGDPSLLTDFIAYTDRFGRDIGPRASQAAADWQRGIADLKLVLGGFDQVVEAAFGANTSEILDTFVTAIVFGKELVIQAVDQMHGAFSALSKGLDAVLTGDLGGAADAVAEFAGYALGQNLIPAFDDAVAATEEFVVAREKLRTATTVAAADEVGFASAIDDTTTKVKKLKDELKGFTENDLKDFLAGWDKWRHEVAVSEGGEDLVKLHERIEDINQALADGYLTQAEAQRLRADAESEYWGELDKSLDDFQGAWDKTMEEAKQKAKDAAEEVVSTFSSAFSDIFSAAASFAGQELDARTETAQELRDRILAFNDAIAAEEDEDVKAKLEAARETVKEQLAIENDAAKRAFEAQKENTLAGIAVDTAGAVVKAYLDLGPIWGSIATAGILAVGAAQAASVAKETYTPYHAGGLVTRDRMASRPDEVPILAQTGEVVQSRQGVQNMGGPEVAQAFNTGRLTLEELMGGMGGAIYLRHELVDRVVTESSRMTGSGVSRMLRSTRPRGWRNHHDRRI